MKRLDGKPKVYNNTLKFNKFVEKARKKHGFKYDYSKVEYSNCKNPIEIVCCEHGSFYQTPDRHVQGAGCSYCNENKGGVKYTTADIVERFIKSHGDRYDYSRVNYVNANTKVEIICKEHGSFHQLPQVHIYGSGCSKCVNYIRYTLDEFIKNLKKKCANVEYVSGFTKMTEICKFKCYKHGDFDSKPFNVLNSKHSCKFCANENIGISLSKGKQKIISEIESIGQFKVLSVIDDGHFCYNSKTKVVVECLKHKTVETRVSGGLKDTVGCSKCLFERKQEAKLYNTEMFIKLAKEYHGDAYDYSKVDYKRSNKNITVICKTHGDFTVSPTNHIQGQGCQKCTVRSNWSRDGFVKFSQSKYGGKSSIYLIKCKSDTEEFIKVGYTCKTVKDRFSTNLTMPYDYEVILEIKSEAGKVYDIEKDVKHKFKSLSYKPSKDFGGKTECFNVDAEDDILKFIRSKNDQASK